jgi:dihydrofolate reductase
MYETMVAWETLGDEDPVLRDFAEIWRAAEKVVYSSTLEGVASARTRIEREFSVPEVRALKDSSDRDLSVGGPGLAGEAIKGGLVDEYHLFVNPIVVGAGTHWLPGGVRLELELVGERRFAGGVVHLHYRTR